MESTLKVIEHMPAFWFLLAFDNRLLLDVNCEHGAVSYDVLIELNEEESSQYAALGRNYLSTLAEAVNYSAPGARGSDSVYKGRNISTKYRHEMASAIEFWNASQAKSR
jgi:hypothetical protein